MKRLFLFLKLIPIHLVIVPLILMSMTQDFRSNQKSFSRVKLSYEEKETIVRKYFSAKGLKMEESIIFLRAFKTEKILEVWASKKDKESYQLIKTYKFCETSGKIGPKRRMGDNQIPEGIYKVNRFNPDSNFFLSVGINYPNKSDEILGHLNPGNDIFIHGGCETVGCIPITDDLMKELYVMCVEAKMSGQNALHVHIFPFKMSLAKINAENEFPFHHNFWKNLLPVYDHFEKNKSIPLVSIDERGKYSIE